MRKAVVTFVVVLCIAASAWAKERSGVVEMSFDLSSHGGGEARLWVPYPVSGDHQKIANVKTGGTYSSAGVYREPETGAMVLHAEWKKGSGKKTLTLSFEATGSERKVEGLKDSAEPFPAEVMPFLRPTRLIPTGGTVGETAAGIIKGKKGTLEKARAVYDWVVANTFRDPDVKGCGAGIVEETLAKRGGKCADISTVFVALSRAAGVPARDVFGMRLGTKPEQDTTTGYNCWAEFYLPGTGWVPVNPADVRKIMLKKNLTLEQAKKYVEYYFGAVDEYRIELVHEGRDVTLAPPQAGGPVNYFMYPYAEIDGRALDYKDPKTFKYSIRFREL